MKYKIIMLMLLIIILLSLSVSSYTCDRLCGDLNYDNFVTGQDRTALQNYLIGTGYIQFDCADTDGNGFIDMGDVASITNYLDYDVNLSCDKPKYQNNHTYQRNTTINHTYQSNVTLIKEYCPTNSGCSDNKIQYRPFYEDSLCKLYEKNITQIKFIERIKQTNYTINQTCENQTKIITNTEIKESKPKIFTPIIVAIIFGAIGYLFGSKKEEKEIFKGDKYD